MAERKVTPYSRTHAGGLGGGAQRCPLQVRGRGQEYLPFMKGCSTCAQETYVACAVSCQDPESWPGKCQSANKCMHTGSALSGCGWDMTILLGPWEQASINAWMLRDWPAYLVTCTIYSCLTQLFLSPLCSPPQESDLHSFYQQLTYSQALSETQ